MTKVFNGRAATEEYMSTHSLTFSTPEMTLKKFVLWLGEQVNQPAGKEPVPRLMLYIEEKGSSQHNKDSDLMPDTDDVFRPSGAVTDMYIGAPSTTEEVTQRTMTPIKEEAPELEVKFCFECGSKLKVNSKFCRSCGAKQE